MSSNRYVVAGSMALVLFVLAANSANANTIIYQDNFSGSGELNGQHPTVGSGTWSTTTTHFTEAGGSVASDGQVTAALPFTPVANRIYTLSVQASVNDGTTDNWLALGFVPNTTDHTQPYSNGADPWMLVRGNSATQAFSTGNTAVQFGSGVSGNVGPALNTMELVLNTTAAQWTVAAFINGKADGTFTYTPPTPANPSIGGVFIGGQTSGSFQNFSLTATPEPGSFVLGGLGAIGLVLVAARRRRKA